MSLRRTVAAPNVTALRAAAQMKPPASIGETFNASGSRRRNFRIDPFDVPGHAAIVRLVSTLVQWPPERDTAR